MRRFPGQRLHLRPCLQPPLVAGTKDVTWATRQTIATEKPARGGESVTAQPSLGGSICNDYLWGRPRGQQTGGQSEATEPGGWTRVTSDAPGPGGSG